VNLRHLSARARSGWRSSTNRSIGGSLFASGSLQLAVIISGVLVARSLGPEDRGHLALLVLISTVCCLIGTIGLPLALTYYIARDGSHARQIAFSLLRPGVFQVVATLGLQTAVLAALVVDEPGRVKAAALISLLLVPGVLAFAYGTAILQGQQRFTAFNILRILPTAAYVAGVLVAFMLHAADLISVMTVWATAYFVGGFLALGVAVRGLPTAPASSPPPSRSRMTKFGLKSLFGSISPIDALRLDQALVGLFVTPVALGLYVVAQAFTNLPRIVAASIGMVVFPQVAAHQDRAAARRAVWKYFLLGTALCALVVAALEVVAAELVTLFFGSEFSEATSIAQILILGTFFMAARRVLSDGVNGLGNPGLGTAAEVASWVLLVPSVAILLPRYGVDGVALALTFAWAGSLLFLVALVAVGEPRLADAWRSIWGLLRRLTTRPRFVTNRELIGLAAVVAVAVAAAITVALLPPSAALIAIAVLSAALFIAFGRSALRQKAHTLRVRLAGARSTRDDGEAASVGSDAEFRLARRLYYLGLVFLTLLTFRVAGQVTYSDILFLFSFVLACTELVVARRRVPMLLPSLLLIGMALFSLGGLLSTFYSLEAFKSTAVIVRLIFLTVFWFWLGTVVLNSREHVMKAATVWVASAAVCGSAAALQVLGGEGLPLTGELAFGRATGFTAQPNDLGGLTAVAFVPALMLAARRRISVPQRVFSYLLLLLVGGGLILSGSVGGLLAAAAATFVWFAFQRTSIESLLVFTALGACVVGVMAVQAVRGAPTPLERIDTVTRSSSESGGAGTLDSRIAIYRVAAASIREHPLVGVGLDLVSVTKPFGVVSYEYEVHNLVIGTWYKAGLLGLVGIMIAFFAVLRTGWIAILQSKAENEQMLAVALVGSVVAFVTFAMSEPVLFSRYGWISAALLLALRGVQVRGLSVSSVADPAKNRRKSVVLAPLRP
jgi:O-antigen/teichoic acid export membrane protein/O-antigen ligase